MCDLVDWNHAQCTECTTHCFKLRCSPERTKPRHLLEKITSETMSYPSTCEASCFRSRLNLSNVFTTACLLYFVRYCCACAMYSGFPRKQCVHLWHKFVVVASLVNCLRLPDWFFKEPLRPQETIASNVARLVCLHAAVSALLSHSRNYVAYTRGFP